MRTVITLVVCLVCFSAQSQQIVRIGFPTAYGFKSKSGVGSIQFIIDDQLNGFNVTPNVGTIFWGFLIPVYSSVVTPVADIKPKQIKVFPNPFDQSIKIENNGFGPYTFHLMDVQGHLLMYDKTSGAIHNINTQFLPSGMYVLRITGQDGNFELHKTSKW